MDLFLHLVDTGVDTLGDGGRGGLTGIEHGMEFVDRFGK
jgi:hypothetical protein